MKTVAAAPVETSNISHAETLKDAAALIAVGIAAYLAATYLCADALREGQHQLAEAFRRRALITGIALGAVALGGIALLHTDAPGLFDGLTHRALPRIVDA